MQVTGRSLGDTFVLFPDPSTPTKVLMANLGVTHSISPHHREQCDIYVSFPQSTFDGY